MNGKTKDQQKEMLDSDETETCSASSQLTNVDSNKDHICYYMDKCDGIREKLSPRQGHSMNDLKKYFSLEDQASRNWQLKVYKSIWARGNVFIFFV